MRRNVRYHSESRSLFSSDTCKHPRIHSDIASSTVDYIPPYICQSAAYPGYTRSYRSHRSFHIIHPPTVPPSLSAASCCPLPASVIAGASVSPGIVHWSKRYQAVPCSFGWWPSLLRISLRPAPLSCLLSPALLPCTGTPFAHVFLLPA